jgi:formylglycine-generating enzyme required for sulfatase activity
MARLYSDENFPGPICDALRALGHDVLREPYRLFWRGTGIKIPLMETPKVKIDWQFAIASKEVTVAQFLKFRQGREDFKERAPTPDCPVLMVSWFDAAAYCNWLSAQEGIPNEQWCYLPNEKGEYADGMKLAPDVIKRNGYRLPTEAEWEYACRAGTRTEWFCGATDELVLRYAWVSNNALGRSHPVGLLKPNELGLFDMHGNAWEWCQDERKDFYYVGRRQNEYARALRGGAFISEPVQARSAYRHGGGPAWRLDNFGFRPARTYR